MFFLLAKSIEDIPNKAKGEGDLMLLLSDVEVLKKIARSICKIIIKHEKIKHEDGRDFFSMDQWKTLYSKVKGKKFEEERGVIEKGRSFATAYNTPMGQEIEECMLRAIQTGYEQIDTGKIDMDGIYYMNIYRTLSIRWEEKILLYKKNIERIRTIIYKEK